MPDRDNFAARLAQALDAISAAHEPPAAPQRVFRPTNRRRRQAVSERSTGSAEPTTLFVGWLRALDGMPPIRLPIGPAIPWRLGLPALIGFVLLMALVGRTGGQAEAQGVRLPAQETYAVQQEAPLFTGTSASAAQSREPAPTQTPTPLERRPLGVQEPAGMGFDIADVGLKLIAVLALAYGSMLVLKRTGLNGASGLVRGSAGSQNLRVVSTLALAPNRTVHAIVVPGGKTLLIGATPNHISFLADLGDSPVQDERTARSEAGTFGASSRVSKPY